MLKNFIKNKAIDHEESLDRVIYGFEVNRICSKGKQKSVLFFVSHSDNRIIEFISKGSKTLERIDITKITEIEFTKKRGNFAKMELKKLNKLPDGLCLSLFIGNDSIDLVFESDDDINQFCFAIWHLWKNEVEEDAHLQIHSNYRGIKNANIKQIWNKYDEDHSGKLELKEFTEFLQEIRINVGKQISAKELFLKVDTDKSGKIDYNEFVSYFEELTSAKEFAEVFEKYSQKSEYLNIFDLIKFMFEVQNESISTEDAIRLILNYNKEINDIIHLETSSILEK